MNYPLNTTSPIEPPKGGIYADLSQNEASAIWAAFHLPEHLEYTQDVHEILSQFHQCCCHLANASNKDLEQQKVLTNAIEKLAQYKSDEHSPQSEVTRKDLYNDLTHYPLITTLILIARNSHNEKAIITWLLLTARIYLNAPTNLYQSLLELDKSRLDITDDIIEQVEISYFYQFTNNELADYLTTLPESNHFSSIAKLLRQQNMQRSTRIFAQGTLFNVSEHESDLEVINECVIVADEEIQHAHLLECIEKPNLTRKQRKSLYQRRKGGKANAVARANQKLAFSQQSITPLQFGNIAKTFTPEVFDTVIEKLDCKLIAFYIIFYLEVFFNKTYAALKKISVFNDNSRLSRKTNTDDCEALGNSEVGIYYQLSHGESCEVNAVLPKSLVKSRQYQDTDDTQFYRKSNCSTSLSIALPFPIPTLFNWYLRTGKANKRGNDISLETFLKVETVEYKQWLKSRKDNYSENCSHHLTPSSIRSAFHHFQYGNEPDIYSQICRSTPSTQGHYSNLGIEKTEDVITKAWFAFLGSADIPLPHIATNEINTTSLFSNDNLLGTFGCDYVLDEYVLDKIVAYFEEVFTEASNQSPSQLKQEAIKTSQDFAVYLGFRVAYIALLRPEKKPFPSFDNVSLVDCLIALSDKNSHQNNAKRLAFLDEKLCQIWSRWRIFYRPSPSVQQYAIAYLNDKNQWCEVQRDELEQLLLQY
ncbi:hypothetical protein [Thalassomonas sp. M1454]|uniref:hypothetical protein n=1 Tax=Thalassomonas sp. M1454 TaxID=2594477 RepID=UPI00117C0108|nr:hypothetical protein [Thalassomonas sp. M1454]TRX57173.1 hypothetical protein FNN08_06655 [Thalassomonas sp. M1454]